MCFLPPVFWCGASRPHRQVAAGSRRGAFVVLPSRHQAPLVLNRMARACLNLMAAMVTQGPEAARDVCSHFDLNKKTLYALVTKRDPKVRSVSCASPPAPSVSFPSGGLQWFLGPPLSGLGPHVDGAGGLCVEGCAPRQPL